MNSIQENWQRVQERIAQAALRAGRSPQEITLVAVSKKQSLEKIRLAVGAGARVLGENYVQEAQDKVAALGTSLEWHLIGHLQKNKVKFAVPLFDLIHTVDSLELARVIDQRARLEGKIQRILVQINVGQEESKSGASAEEALELVVHVSELSNLSLEGLMTVPPIFDDSEQVRPYFVQLRNLRDYVNKYRPPKTGCACFKHLSMGMSHDFEVAIEEGATLVRVGSAIFGSRN